MGKAARALAVGRQPLLRTDYAALTWTDGAMIADTFLEFFPIDLDLRGGNENKASYELKSAASQVRRDREFTLGHLCGGWRRHFARRPGHGRGRNPLLGSV